MKYRTRAPRPGDKLRQCFYFTSGLWPNERNDGNTYTEIDRELSELDCCILQNCQRGKFPKMLLPEDIEGEER